MSLKGNRELAAERKKTKIDYEEQRRALRQALKHACKAAGLTLAQVAAKLGKPQSFVAKYENGGRRLEAVELREIARALTLDPKSLLVG